ncbi:hypothetical protein PIROE2DRAFT_46831 [Piromyces sp. E2]|nr:hypothetical protein PIROE2DRAFT_46831 [Piromyces sp. E2]|eukprot:OUM59692.1 hypothetical protein PIROE2DRAFT_46831 [Piromyces sp. E2]
MEKILKITIPTCSQRQKSKPHIVYHITVAASIRTWTVQHRYSEFFNLNKKFLDLGLKPPLELPPKSSIFSFTSYDNPKFVEARRQGLEEYLQAILASKDERFKKLPEWKEFLGITQLKNRTDSEDYNITSSEQWLEECRNLDLVINEIRTCIAARNKFVTRNETAAACEAIVLARKNHSILLESNPGFFSSVLGGMKKQKSRTLLSKGELSRRQDLLENIRREKIELEKLLGNAKSTDNSSQSNVSDKGYYSVKNGSNNRQTGNMDNKESTQGLDNIQILQLQKNMLKDQDKTLEQFSSILNRQRKIGETINQELDLQNEILDDLDNNVNKVQLGLGQAEKRMKKVLKK